MKVKIIKEYRVSPGRFMRVGTVLPARYFPSNQLIHINPTYQVIGGEFSGCKIPNEYCIETPKEKTYSEKEWNDMENHYLKLVDDERDRANDLEEKLDAILKPLMEYIEQVSVSIQVDQMLKEWLDTSYEGSEEVDRKNFSLKLTKFIQEKLV